MSCASIEDLLLNFAELPTQERVAVDLHLTQCAGCRQYAEALAQLDAALTERFSGVQPSELLHSRLHAVTTSQSPLSAPSFVPELLDLIGVAGIVFLLLLIPWKSIPLPEFTDFIPIVGILLPVCAGIALFVAAWLGARVYGEFKS